MKYKSDHPFVLSLVTVGLTLAFASSSQAATSFWSPTAPSVDGADIANFVGAGSDAENTVHPEWGAGDDEGTYIAANRPAQGQTFSTGGELLGYNLNAITLQHVSYEPTWWSVDAGWTGYNGARFKIEIGTIALDVFTPIATEEAYMDVSAPANGAGVAGTGLFVALTLDTPVALAANSSYAFMVTTVSDFNPWDAPYFELNGNGESTTFTGGEAFILTGTPGGENQTYDVVNLTGDRVFHLDLDVVVPEPSSGLLALSGLGLLLGWRRRRS